MKNILRNRHNHLIDVPYTLIFIYAIFLILVAFVFQNPTSLLKGFFKILVSPSNLITDYFVIGGIGSAFFNSGITTLFSAFLLKKSTSVVTGPLLASVFTVSGFSLFGKNIFNSISITLGVYLYAKYKKIELKEVTLTAMFATCLSPIVSEIAFNFKLNPILMFILSQVTGLLVGFLIPVLSLKLKEFHKGFSLYNIGFSAGVLGMVLVGFFRMFGLNINIVDIEYRNYNYKVNLVFLTILFTLLLLGLIMSKFKLKRFLDIQKEPGVYGSDFILKEGLGATLINMGLVGFIGFSYIVMSDATLNGPTIGALLTLIGFASFGKTIRNIIPIMIGITLANTLNIYSTNDTGTILTCLFGTTLAPIAGYFGVLSGIAAGFLHVALVNNIGVVHGGINLYNNGFSGGFIATFLVPLLEEFKVKKSKYSFSYTKNKTNELL